jgi:hypothetical protein
VDVEAVDDDVAHSLGGDLDAGDVHLRARGCRWSCRRRQ